MENGQENQQLSRKERIELRREERRAGSETGGKSGLKRALLWLVVIAIIGGGVYGAVKLAGKNNNHVSDGALYAAVGAGDWFEGNKNAKTVLVEYSDYECPACALFYPEVNKIISENSDKIQFVYRNFPLQQHLNATIAAYSAEAAGKQGKFWEMHDKLFTNQNSWAPLTIADARNVFIGYATDLKLNTDQFKKDMDSQAVKDKVANDYQTGVKSGVNATPTFYLDGKKMAPPTSLDDFRNTILQSINAK